MTYPQIILTNYAASFNHKRMELEMARRRKAGKPTVEDEMQDLTVNGKKLTEMSSDEIVAYMGNDGPRPRFIKTQRPST